MQLPQVVSCLEQAVAKETQLKRKQNAKLKRRDEDLEAVIDQQITIYPSIWARLMCAGQTVEPVAYYTGRLTRLNQEVRGGPGASNHLRQSSTTLYTLGEVNSSRSAEGIGRASKTGP